MNRSSIYRPGPHPNEYLHRHVRSVKSTPCAGADRIHALLRHADDHGSALTLVASASKQHPPVR